jgi:hypothetical protein
MALGTVPIQELIPVGIDLLMTVNAGSAPSSLIQQPVAEFV